MKISQEEFDNIMIEHDKWLKSDFGKEADGKRANFDSKDLSDINLSERNLSYVTFKFAYLESVDFSHSDLRKADLSHANLEKASFFRANLSSATLERVKAKKTNFTKANLKYSQLNNSDFEEAYFIEADVSETSIYAGNFDKSTIFNTNVSCSYLASSTFRFARLQSSNFSGTNFKGSNFKGVVVSDLDLKYADLAGCAYVPQEFVGMTSIVPEGEIIGWKKTRQGIAKLLIPADAKRSNATGRKCRAEFAKVLEMEHTDGTPYESEIMTSLWDTDFIYRVGDVVRPTNNFHVVRWEECAPGIHFYITKIEALNHD